MNQISLRTASTLCLVIVMASILAFATKPITVYVKKPIKTIRKDIGSRFKVPVFDDDDDQADQQAAGEQATGDQTGEQQADAGEQQATTGDQQATAGDQAATTGQSQDWTWGAFGTSVGTGAVAGGLGGALGGAAAGSLAGGVGAGPGAVAGGVAGAVGGAVGGAVRYAWTYFGGSVDFVNVYILPDRALDFSSQINQLKNQLNQQGRQQTQ